MDKSGGVETAKLVTLNILAYSFLVYNNSTLVYYNTPYILYYFLGSNSLIFFTYLSVVISFIGRILGGNYLARIGDKYSRRFLTRMSSIGSSVPLIIIAFLPPIQASLYVFLLLYFFQGFFTGGLTGGLNVIGLENLEEKHRGWFSGTGISVGGFSYLIVTTIYFLTVKFMGVENYSSLGWKISFLVSILIIPFSLLMPESVKQVKSRAKDVRIWEFKKELIKCIGIIATFSSLNLLAQGTLPNFLFYVNKINGTQLNELMLYYSFVAIPSGFLGGWLSEVIGRKRSFILGLSISPIASLCYFILGETSDYLIVTLLVLIIAFILNFGGGGVMAFANESFPTRVRSSGVAISWGIGWFIGSIVQLVNTLLTSLGFNFAIITSVSILIISIIGLPLSFIIPETRGNLDKI